MFKYIYNTPNLDVTAGKSLSGWNISNHDQKIHGGISPTMRDGISRHATDDEAESDMENMDLVCSFLFKNTTLPGAQTGLFFASLLRYWPVFVRVCEVQVKKPNHFVINQVKLACNAAKVSYKEDFLRWADTCSTNFYAKNALGLPSPSMKDIPEEFFLDGRNLIESHAQMRDFLNSQTGEMSALVAKSKQQTRQIAGLTKLLYHQSSNFKIISDQVTMLHQTVNKLATLVVQSSSGSSRKSGIYSQTAITNNCRAILNQDLRNF